VTPRQWRALGLSILDAYICCWADFFI
jgi:hypothetical protein